MDAEQFADLTTPKLELFRRRRSISRGLAAVALAQLRNDYPEAVAKSFWKHDTNAALIARAAVEPTALGEIESTSKWLFVSGLAPQSVTVKLFSEATRVDLTGMHLITMTSMTAPSPVFVGEKGITPIASGTTTLASLGPTKKMLLGMAVSGELEFATPETASVLIGRVLTEQAGKSLDAVLLDAVAADADRPPGLLNGVVPIVASVLTGVEGVVEDLRNLGAALAAAGLDPERAVYIANSAQALSIRLLAGPRFTNMILGTPALAAGTVVAVDPLAIASGYSGVPEVEISREGVVHFESATPAAIGTAGSPNTVAAPVRSAWQENLLLLKLRMKCCWGVLVPGAVQVVTGVAW